MDAAVEREFPSLREAQSVRDLNANSASRAGAVSVLAQPVLTNARHEKGVKERELGSRELGSLDGQE